MLRLLQAAMQRREQTLEMNFFIRNGGVGRDFRDLSALGTEGWRNPIGRENTVGEKGRTHGVRI